MPISCRSRAPRWFKTRPAPQPISRTDSVESPATSRQYERSPSAAKVRSRSSASRRLRTSDAVSLSGRVPSESFRQTPYASPAR
jgi:hypothetical protein